MIVIPTSLLGYYKIKENIDNCETITLHRKHSDFVGNFNAKVTGYENIINVSVNYVYSEKHSKLFLDVTSLSGVNFPSKYGIKNSIDRSLIKEIIVSICLRIHDSIKYFDSELGFDFYKEYREGLYSGSS